MLMEDNEQQCVEATCEFLRAYETNGKEFLDSTVTEDETWAHYKTREMKKQYHQWKRPESLDPRKFKQTLSAGKAVVCWQSEDERLLGQEGVIVVRIHACRDNNQCGLLLSDAEEASRHNSKEEERHAHEGNAFASGQHSSTHCLCNKRSHQQLCMGCCHTPALQPRHIPK